MSTRLPLVIRCIQSEIAQRPRYIAALRGAENKPRLVAWLARHGIDVDQAREVFAWCKTDVDPDVDTDTDTDTDTEPTCTQETAQAPGGVSVWDTAIQRAAAAFEASQSDDEQPKDGNLARSSGNWDSIVARFGGAP